MNGIDIALITLIFWSLRQSNITRKFFSFKGKQPMYNKNVNVTKHKDTDEQIMFFIKD